MKIIHRTYRFKLQPSKVQQVLLNKHFGAVRWVYNHFLTERKSQYLTSGRWDRYNKQAASLTALKKQPETPWLKVINSQSLQSALRHLDKAFVNFFDGTAKFPRFKSKKAKNSFTVPQFVVVESSRLYFPKFKDGIKIHLHRPIEGSIRHCTLCKSPTGKYFVSILCEVKYQPQKATGKCCGIDLGLKDFVVTSDGARFKNARHLIKYERKLLQAQKHLSRKVNGSANHNKQRLKLARIYEKVANSRLNLLHKVSTQIINAYDIICVEDLNVRGMLYNHKLAKHISDVSWSTFVELLKYKAVWNDKQLVKNNRFHPSSKTCYECGWVNNELTLFDRVWTCPNGHILDRDLTASKNILKEGLKKLSGGTLDYTHGDGSSELSVK